MVTTTFGASSATTFESVTASRRNDKMTLQSATSRLEQDDFYDSIEQERNSLETESITLTNNNETSSSSSSSSSSSNSSNNSDQDEEEEVEGEVIGSPHHYEIEQQQQQQEEEELDEYQIMLREAEKGVGGGYKRMELKGESESDKDLIIYSLNESLQIHKDIVERIQNEKDDLQDHYELEKSLKEQAQQDHMEKMEREKEQGQAKINQLEQIYTNMMGEMENKKLEYKRMETRFHAHVKGIKQQDQYQDGLSSMTIQINQLLTNVGELCSYLSTTTSNKVTMQWWSEEDMDRYNQALQHLDAQQVLAILTEKKMMEILVEDIFDCSIHPGVSLNKPFHRLHQWVEKRNTSWASRMKQQITSFIVQQSTEETDKIQQAQQDIVAKIFLHFNQVYAAQDTPKEGITKLVEMAMQLNLNMKCCQEEYKIDILPIVEMHDSFNQDYMVGGLAPEKKDLVLLVVSPPFVAKQKSGVIVPAKVFC